MKEKEKESMDNLAREIKKYTYQDLLEIDDNNRYELIDGEIYMMAPPIPKHQLVAGEIYRQLANYLEGKKCTPFISPIGVCFSGNYNPRETENFVEPDVIVVCDENKITDKCINGAPDLIIEVLSDGSKKMDVLKKYNLYQRCGVREYWIVDIETEVIYQYILNEENIFTLPKAYDIKDSIKVNILKDCTISLKELMKKN